MVNNTAQDRKPYFMTANHCGIHAGNAASLVVYWNYENSTCRPVGSPASGGPGNGLLNQYQTGSYFRAAHAASDFTLVELDDDPDPAWGVSYAGWDRTGAEAAPAVAIHHPNTDEKRISIAYAATQTTSYLGTLVPGNGTHVRVIDWNLGTTEPGSSGSPLFDQNHRVIGQLHGGYAACGNNESDWYGRFSASWTGGGTPSTRLSNWLDPGGTGAMTTNTISSFSGGLTVSPSDSVTHSGPLGGPFTHPTVIYTLGNPSSQSIPYRVRLTESFGILLNGGTGDVTGILAANGGSAQVAVTLGSSVQSLPGGTYVETIEFVDEAAGTVQTRTHTVEVGHFLYDSLDVPKTINDNATVISVVAVTDAFCIADVNVSVNITHTYRGDLTVDLISPAGVTVRLHNRTGGSADHIITTYDDEGGTVPDGPGRLADFVNTPAMGTWTLRVQDHAGGDTGVLNSWALRIVAGAETCPPQAQDLSVTLPEMQTSHITLAASTDSGNPLHYVIESLPAHGTLRDPNGGTIGSVPYVLGNYGNVVRYTPTPISYTGADSFTFSANDGQPSNLAEVSIVVGGPRPIYVWTLDTNPGWTTQGLWAWGPPTGGGGSHGNPDPTGGHTGTNVYGYNLNGDYTNSMSEMHLTSTAIDCSEISSVSLKFWRWLGVERNRYDHAYVRVSNNGTNWTTIWQNSDVELTDSSWVQQTFDIAAIADHQPTVYLRWTMGSTDGSWTYCGWNIDDIEIWGLAPGVPGDCNGDYKVDLDDYVDLAACLSGPTAPVSGGCECFDLDGNERVDLLDFSQFEILMTE